MFFLNIKKGGNVVKPISLQYAKVLGKIAGEKERFKVFGLGKSAEVRVW
jgi:hypothetical protein